jgi:hypothetical protein
MSENIIIKKEVSKTEFNKTQDKYMVKKQIRSHWANPITLHRLSRNPIKVEDVWEEIPNISKKVSLNALLRKIALDPQSMEQITGYFLIKVDANVLSDKMYRFIFLSICDNRIFMHNTSGGMTAPLALTGESEGIEKTISKPVRITDIRAGELLEAGAPMFEMQKEGEYRQVV